MKISNTSNNSRQKPVVQATTYQSKHQPLVQPSHQHPPTLKPSQSPHQAHNQTFEKVFPQMPNGFEYNPYKIMGFQNKETNEFALNVLKSQNFDNLPQAVQPIAMAAGQPPSHSGPRQTYVPIQINPSYAARPPPPQQNAIPIQTLAPVQHYNAAAVAEDDDEDKLPLQPFTWMLKPHDLCFAKYWEDKRVSCFLWHKRNVFFFNIVLICSIIKLK